MENKTNLDSRWINIINKYDLLVFDFDGTVTEPLTVDWRGLKKELHKMLSKPYDQKNTIDTLLYEIRKNLKEQGIKKAYQFVKDYEKKSIRTSHLNKNFLELLVRLSKNKRKAIFSTNMRDTIINILKKNNLSNLFDCIVSKEDVMKYKPDPEGLLSILHYFKTPASKALYIGDLNVDLIVGENAKIKTILLN